MSESKCWNCELRQVVDAETGLCARCLIVIRRANAEKRYLNELRAKCNFAERARMSAEREGGCPLDHCACGTHDPNHVCERDEIDEEVAAAERAAGWDPNP